MSEDKTYSGFTPGYNDIGTPECTCIYDLKAGYLKETYQKFEDEMSKVTSPEDKKKVLESVFPDYEKNSKMRQLQQETQQECTTKYDKLRTQSQQTGSVKYGLEHIEESVKRLSKQFPELASQIETYANASVVAAVKGEKNKFPKPAAKLPFWKRAVAPVAKLFGGKYAALDNITKTISAEAAKIGKSQMSSEMASWAKGGFDERPIYTVSGMLGMVTGKLQGIDGAARQAHDELYHTIDNNASMIMEDKLYQAAAKEFDTKSPAIIQKNKTRTLLAQRGLIPATKSTKEVSGVVKVDQNIMAQAANKYKQGR